MIDGQAVRVLVVLEDVIESLSVASLLSTLPVEGLPHHVKEIVNLHLGLETRIVDRLDTKRRRWDKQTNDGEEEPQDDNAEQQDEEEVEDDEVIDYRTSLHRTLATLMHDPVSRKRLLEPPSPQAISTFTHTWSQVYTLLHQHCQTTREQDDALMVIRRESIVRLQELGEDRRQVAFELDKEQKAHTESIFKYTSIITRLQNQLNETQCKSEEILEATRRQRQRDMETQPTTTSTSQMTMGLIQNTTRATETHEHVEAEARKRKIKIERELEELIQRYDVEMMNLDAQLETEREAIGVVEKELKRLTDVFEWIDKDKRLQIQEWEEYEKKKANQLENYHWIIRIQSVIRGYLARKEKQKRLQEKRKQSKKGGKKKKKKKKNTKH